MAAAVPCMMRAGLGIAGTPDGMMQVGGLADRWQELSTPVRRCARMNPTQQGPLTATTSLTAQQSHVSDNPATADHRYCVVMDPQTLCGNGWIFRGGFTVAPSIHQGRWYFRAIAVA